MFHFTSHNSSKIASSQMHLWKKFRSPSMTLVRTQDGALEFNVVPILLKQNYRLSSQSRSYLSQANKSFLFHKYINSSGFNVSSVSNGSLVSCLNYSILSNIASRLPLSVQNNSIHSTSRPFKYNIMNCSKRNFSIEDKTKAIDPRLLKQVLPTSSKSHPLDRIFKPRSVAIIGASEKEGSVGRSIFWNLISSPFGGAVYPINSKRKTVMGITAYKNISCVPQEDPVDLAVISIPAPLVLNAVEECAAAGVKGIVIISAGFSEAGEQGKEWAKKIKEIGKENDIRIIGPNCLGVLNPNIGFNATFAAIGAKPGRLALISQSGAIATAMLDYAISENIGFSKFASIGSMIDISFSDLIDYYGQDEETEAIVIYMESIGDARKFMASAASIALTKPIILIKVGKTKQGAQAAVSHTGSMAGSDEVINCAFKRCGVLRVDNVDDLFGITEILAKQPRPLGNKLAIVTNAGGPGIISVDSLISNGGTLSPLSQDIVEKLNDILPEHWSHSNPIDILGDADPQRYSKTLEIIMEDPNSDGVLVILTRQSMTDPIATAEEIINISKRYKKPLFCCFMESTGSKKVLANAGIPNFQFPDQATKYFSLLHKYSRNIDSLFQSAGFLPPAYQSIPESNIAKAKELLINARNENRLTLSEHESKQILLLYGISTPESYIATTREEALNYANKIGFPVVLKLHSHTITHKQDVGGVKLNLRREQDVIEAFDAIKSAVETKDFLGCSVQPMEQVRVGYELIIGSMSDQQFGPTILFGTGGSFVEVYKDTVLGLPPLSYDYAQKLIESTNISKILSGYRGREPVNLEDLKTILVRFSRLVMDNYDFIKEIDINPLLATSSHIRALDARIILHPLNVVAPKPALRQYPREYNTSYDELDLKIRHVRIRDFDNLIPFFTKVSESLKTLNIEEKALQYMNAFNLMKASEESNLPGRVKQLHNSLRRLCIGNYEKDIVMVAETKQGNVVALTRCSRTSNPIIGELAIIIDPDYQRKGLGTFMLNHLLSIAKKEGMVKIRSVVSEFNLGFIRQSSNLGFREISRTGGEILFEIDLI